MKAVINSISPKSSEQIKEIYNFDVGAFADSQDFEWTEENIQNEMKAGWEIYSVKVENEVVCALFIKEDGPVLLTKNTPIRLDFQGKGLSHEVKEFYEELAQSKGIKSIYNYCPEDNFRMISLNEGHDYQKTGNTLAGSPQMIEWEKKL